MDYITLSDLMQIMIAFSTTGAFITALAVFYIILLTTKRNNRLTPK